MNSSVHDTTPRRAARTATAAVLVTLLAGCGHSSSPATTRHTPTSTSPAATTTPPASSAPATTGLPTTAAPPSGSTSAGRSGNDPAARPGSDPADVLDDFPTPPGTKQIRSYGSIGLTPEQGQKFYLSTSGLATVQQFYVDTLRGSGWRTYVDPTVHRSGSTVTGYLYQWHQGSVTLELDLDADYLKQAPGTVLIEAELGSG